MVGTQIVGFLTHMLKYIIVTIEYLIPLVSGNGIKGLNKLKEEAFVGGLCMYE